MKAELTKNLKKIGLMVKKYSPEILTVVGVTAGVAGTVVAVKKTLVLEEKILPVKNEIEEIKIEANDKGTDVDKKALTKAYVKATGTILKTYAPAIALETCGVCCVLAANGIMRKRNAGLAAAYTLLDETFKTYRKNVVDELGEEKDYDFLHSLKTEKVEVIEEDPETGKQKKVKKNVKVRKDGELSGYSVLFQPGNLNYTDCPSLNRSFITGIETYVNDKCRRDGYIWLSDVYEQLGFEFDDLSKFQREASRVVGWVWDYSDNARQDKQVDFHIIDKINDRANDAALHNDMNGEAVFVLDFNVDGYILDIFKEGLCEKC